METTTEVLRTSTIKEFVQASEFTSIVPSVRVNTNGYPFLTFIDANNVATNVYFSRKAAAGVAVGTPVTKELLAIYQIGYTKNEAGEERVKLISNSDRVELTSLLD